MPRFFTTWRLYRARALRGRLLEQAVARASGDLDMIDAALAAMVKSKTPVHLSVRRQIAEDLYGLFLPCRVVKRNRKL